MIKKAINIIWISNIVFEPYLQTYIKSAFLADGYETQLSYIMYDEIKQKQEVIQNAEMVVVCLNFHEMYPDTLYKAPEVRSKVERIYKDICGRNRELLSIIKANYTGKVVWFGFEDFFTKNALLFGAKHELYGLVDKVNLSLSEAIVDDIFIDLKRIIALCGIYSSYNDKGKYRWNAPYSKELIKLMADELHKQYLIEKGITKKCLVLDCDNVLWGGIISEDGKENLKLAGNGFGRTYQDFQRFALSLYYHGVILAVCSKNNLSEVLNVFREHSEMVLKEKHIACFQVNWEDKPNNIKIIAERLNIGLDSMVFVDDSHNEIKAVKALLPDVTTVLFKRNMNYNHFSCFNLKSNVMLDDIEKRNETYRTNAQRECLKESFSSYAEYINALDIKTEIHKTIPMEYSRVSELTQRVNKCTNGKRFTVQEIKEYVKNSGCDYYSVHVSDRFSNLGLVGAFAVKDNTLVLFCLSCRALGRQIERKMIEFIIAKWRINKVYFQSTGKNDDLKNALKKKINPVFSE